MTVNDIQIELSRDYDNCMDKVAIECRKIRRTIIKSKRFPIQFEPVEYISPRQNRYLIFLEASSKKNAESPLMTVVALYNKHDGLYAAAISKLHGSITKVNIYPPHFFQRYKERILGENVTTKEAIKLFFRNNSNIAGDMTNENEFKGSCKEGFVFGTTISYTIDIIKTIISNNMLKGTQIDLSSKMSKWVA
jgi:hypothetical protein